MSPRNLLQRHPISMYFVLTFVVSWALAFLVVAPNIVRGQSLSYFSGIMMFPAMLVGPFLVGLVMTRAVDGGDGLRGLFADIKSWQLGRWYIPAIVIPPIVILVTRLIMNVFVSSAFAPNFFPFGFGFGVIAGFLEEFGWTGYAIRKLSMRYSALASAIVLGGIWGLWHAPVVDFLGAAYPHGAYWLPFYLAFIAVVMAIRVLIVWLYSNTKSILIAQVSHASFTGFLATLAPAAVTPAQESVWYAVCALLLWIVIATIAKRYGRPLRVLSLEAAASKPNRVA